VSELGYSTNHPIVIMNCRDDRVDRTIQFAEDVLPYIPSEIVIAIGGTTSPISDAYERGDLDTNQYFDLEGYSTEEIMEELKPYLKGRVVYGVGNIHGSGEPLIEAINNMQSVRKAG
jgi:hypothetical protein